MSVCDVLLIELYETIIDFLADEKESLSSVRACSLVSHDFLHLARKHLFSTIKINFITAPPLGRFYVGFQTAGKSETLVQLLSRTPEIAKYVRILNFCMRWEDFDIKGLLRVLKMFTQLKSLTIYESPSYTQPLNWANLPLPLKDAISLLLYRPTLIHLTLGPICGFDISDLAHCSKLKYMHVRNVRFAPIHLEAQKFCDIGLEYNERDDPLTAFNANGVLVIKLHTYHAEEVALDEGLRNKAKALFAQCSQLQDIRTFKIDYGDNLVLIQGFAEMILPSLQTLQHIHVRMIPNEKYDDPLGGLPTELTAIAGKNVIEMISINIIFKTDHDCRNDDKWGGLDRALAQRRPGWPKLRSVSLRIEVCKYGPEERLENGLRKLPENQLKGLAKSEDIKFLFEVTGLLW